MWAGLAVVVVGSVVAGAALRGLSWARRRRMVERVDPDAITRQARGVSLRILASGQTALPSLSTTKANRSTGDLVVTDDRLLIVCARGTLVDIQPGRGRLLHVVRAPGPGRLVIETAQDGSSGGAYRIEAVIDGATEWVDALRPFTRPGERADGQ
jgi:hypothetical protein